MIVLPLKNGMCYAHVKKSQLISKFPNYLPISLIKIFDVFKLRIKKYQNKNIDILHVPILVGPKTLQIYVSREILPNLKNTMQRKQIHEKITSHNKYNGKNNYCQRLKQRI